MLQDLIIPLATLLGLADPPGEGHGLGALDPGLCRALAATAAASPHTTVCVTITDPDGIAIGHGCAKPATARHPGRGRGAASPAAVQPRPWSRSPPGSTSPSPPTGWPSWPGRSRAGWALAPRGTPDSAGPPGDPDWCGAWALTLPAAGSSACSWSRCPRTSAIIGLESHGYQPNDQLRHLVQVRDYACTFPPCSRHARDSDFEHAVPYDQGGRTCACNAGARSRKCHRVKQSPGWKVAQPRPGWHQWSTPRGRTYTQGPNRYPV